LFPEQIISFVIRFWENPSRYNDVGRDHLALAKPWPSASRWLTVPVGWPPLSETLDKVVARHIPVFA